MINHLYSNMGQSVKYRFFLFDMRDYAIHLTYLRLVTELTLVLNPVNPV
jgi:hypothetical protein